MPQSVLCINTNKYLERVIVVLLHVRFSFVGPIPFLLAAIFWGGHSYIGSTAVLPDTLVKVGIITNTYLLHAVATFFWHIIYRKCVVTILNSPYYQRPIYLCLMSVQKLQ